MSTLTLTLAVVNLILSVERARAREELLWRTFKAVAWTESRGDPQAVNRRENAVGIAGIRPICVRDVNRIIGREKYTLADRLNVAKSYEMFCAYVYHYGRRGGPEQWARIWCGGPDGPKQACTAPYWRKIQQALK